MMLGPPNINHHIGPIAKERHVYPSIGLKVDNYLWRGPRPERIEQLVQQGFGRVICLQSGFEDATTFTPYEADLVSPPDGFKVVQLHWSNVMPPSQKEVRTFLAIANSGLIKTYVHCHSGVDRTGAAILMYRHWTLGWPFELAYKEFVDKGRHAWFFWWKPFLKRLCRSGRY